VVECACVIELPELKVGSFLLISQNNSLYYPIAHITFVSLY